MAHSTGMIWRDLGAGCARGWVWGRKEGECLCAKSAVWGRMGPIQSGGRDFWLGGARLILFL